MFSSKGPDRKLEVRVSSLGGPVCTVPASSLWAGAELKAAIAKATGIPAKELRLFAGTAMIRDGDELRERLDGEAGLDVTMLRRRPVKLEGGASAAQWFALYVYDLDLRPAARDLTAYAKTRGGRLTYREAERAVALHADPSVPLAELPAPEEPPAPEGKAAEPPPGPTVVAAELSGIFVSQPRKASADAAWGASGSVTASWTAHFRDVEGLRPGEPCALCLSEESGGEHAAVELMCQGSHRFHRACIEAWFSSGLPDDAKAKRYDCPLCRRKSAGLVEAKASGVFVRLPGQTLADAAFGRP